METAITTLAQSMQDHAVSFDELGETYKPDLAIVRELIGVVPNCDNHLEIWPPGFRTYNLVVPNFLNLPGSLLGQGAPKDLVGLAMYASSRAASCMYCSAHTCSFALRRGASAGAVTGSNRSPAEHAVFDAAEALSTIPGTYDRSHHDALALHLEPGDIEWVLLSVAMMGFLNKFMDAIGIELEPEALSDVSELIEPTGWSPGQHLWDEDLAFDRDGPLPPKDSFGTYTRVIRQLPGAIKLDRAWSRGLPSAPRELRDHIADRYGFDEPVLTRLTHKRASRATAALLRQNLEPTQSLIGIKAKALAGIIFAVKAGNDDLARRLKDLALGAAASESMCEEWASFAANDASQASTAELGISEPTEAAVARLALAIAPSPAVVMPDMVELASATLSPAQTIETAVWISVLQLLHRLHLYLEVATV